MTNNFGQEVHVGRKKSASTPRKSVAAVALTELEYQALMVAARKQDTTMSRLIRRTLISSGVIASQDVEKHVS
jgi:DNA-binding MarR family transcriptional regulator